MKSFWNLIKHRYFKVAAVVTVLLVLPLVLFASRQTQEFRGRAQQGTTLSFLPSSSKPRPITVNVNDGLPLDVVINPGGTNLISLLRLDITYDSSVLELSPNNPFVVNSDIFPEILEGPVYTNGRIQVVLSVGYNQTKAIATQSTVATLNFVAKSATNRSTVDFGSNVSAYSVASTDGNNENVIGNLESAYIKINDPSSKGGKGGGKPGR